MLEYFFGPRNPTRTWPPGVDQTITFNLDNASLNAVCLSESLDLLSFLGPDEDRKSFRNGEVLYPSKGLAIRFSPRSHSLVEYRIVQSDPLDDRFLPFRGTVLVNGRSVSLAALQPARFVDEYGDFYWRDTDDDESILFYEFVGMEWQIEFDRGSHLKCITVTNEPIMCDEVQRIAYGVTAPWPPRSGKGT
jgi:hypothetical protein